MACSAARGVVTQQCTRRPSVLSPSLLDAVVAGVCFVKALVLGLAVPRIEKEMWPWHALVAPAAVLLAMAGQPQLLRVTLERQSREKPT